MTSIEASPPAAGPAVVDRRPRSGFFAGAVYGFCRGLCRIIATLMFDLKVYGRHHVPDQGGALMISNHQSYLDPALLGVQIRRHMSFLAKSELFKNRFFGWLILTLNAFPVRQGAGDVGAIRETVRRLQEGHLLNIFPEGGRSEDGSLMPIANGVALIIRKAKVPVVPAVITGAYQAWPKSQKFPRRSPVRVLYGPPMDLSDMKAAQIVETIDRTFRRMLDELHQIQLKRGEVVLDTPPTGLGESA